MKVASGYRFKKDEEEYLRTVFTGIWTNIFKQHQKGITEGYLIGGDNMNAAMNELFNNFMNRYIEGDE